MKKILLTSATHSLSLRVANLLKDKFDIVLATAEQVPSFMSDKYLRIPQGANPTYAHELLKLALDQQCDYILPIQLSEIQALSESIILFEEYGIAVIGPSKDQLQGIEVLANPNSDFTLSLIYNHIDLFTQKPLKVDINGLWLLSDSAEDFILAIGK